MTLALSVVSLLAVLFLVGRGTPLSRWPVILAGTLFVVVTVVAMEQNGWWPAGWRVR